MNILHDAYTALLAGLTTYHPDHPKEIMWEDEHGIKVTIEPVDAGQEKYIVRYYYKNGQLGLEVEYQNGQLHGTNKAYYDNGQLSWEEEYQNGQFHGTCKRYYDNGQLYWEQEYQNGQYHGTSKRYYENGQLEWEHKYQNGVRIK